LLNRATSILTIFGETMKKSKQKKVQGAAQTNYMSILRSLRSRITSEYSKAIKQEYQGIILGYD
jgi:hypothetical protein